MAGAVCPRDKSLGRLSCGVAAFHHSYSSSGAGKLQFRSAAPRAVFGHHVRRLVKCSGPSYPLPDHLRRREGSRPVGLRKAGLPGRQAEVSGLVLPSAAAGRPRSWSAVRQSPAAAGCRPPRPTSRIWVYMKQVRLVPGTPYLTAWANSGKSGRATRERALRLRAIRQARLEQPELSGSSQERMVYGPTATSGGKRIDFSTGIAWFGDIIK